MKNVTHVHPVLGLYLTLVKCWLTAGEGARLLGSWLEAKREETEHQVPLYQTQTLYYPLV